jgi:Transposase DDE domain
MGRKRHAAVDMLGLMLGVAILPADIQDRDGCLPVLKEVRRLFLFLRRIIADGANEPRHSAEDGLCHDGTGASFVGSPHHDLCNGAPLLLTFSSSSPAHPFAVRRWVHRAAARTLSQGRCLGGVDPIKRQDLGRCQYSRVTLFV